MNQNDKKLLINCEIEGENYRNLTTLQLIKLVVNKLDEDVISIQIKKRHKSDDA